MSKQTIQQQNEFGHGDQTVLVSKNEHATVDCDGKCDSPIQNTNEEDIGGNQATGASATPPGINSLIMLWEDLENPSPNEGSNESTVQELAATSSPGETRPARRSTVRELNRNSSAGIHFPKCTPKTPGTRQDNAKSLAEMSDTQQGDRNSSAGVRSPTSDRSLVSNRNENGITLGATNADSSMTSLDPVASAQSSFLSCSSFRTIDESFPECDSFTVMPLCEDAVANVTNICSKSDSIRIGIPNTTMVLDVKVERRGEPVSLEPGASNGSISKVIIQVSGANMLLSKSTSRNEIICSPWSKDDGIVDEVLVDCISNAVDISTARQDRANWITVETVDTVDTVPCAETWVVTSDGGNQYKSETIEICADPPEEISLDTVQPSRFTLESAQEFYRPFVERDDACQFEYDDLKAREWHDEECAPVAQEEGPVTHYAYKSVEVRPNDSCEGGATSPKPGCFSVCFRKRAKSPGKHEVIQQTVSQGSQRSEYEYSWTVVDDKDGLKERKVRSKSSSSSSSERVHSAARKTVRSSSPPSTSRSPHETEALARDSIRSSPGSSSSESVETVTKIKALSSPVLHRKTSSRSRNKSPQSAIKVDEIAVRSAPEVRRRSVDGVESTQAKEVTVHSSPQISVKVLPENVRKAQLLTQIQQVSANPFSPKGGVRTQIYTATEGSELSDDECDSSENIRSTHIRLQTPEFMSPKSSESSTSTNECETIFKVRRINRQSRSPRNRCQDETQNIGHLFRQISAMDLQGAEDALLDLPCPRRRPKRSSSVRESIHKFFSHTSIISLSNYRTVVEEIYPKEVLKKIRNLDYSIYIVRLPILSPVKTYRPGMSNDDFGDKSDRTSIRFKTSSTAECSDVNTSFDTKIISHGGDHGRDVRVTKTQMLYTIESRIKGALSCLESSVPRSVQPIVANSLQAALLDIRQQIDALPNNVCGSVHQGADTPVFCQSVCRSICDPDASCTVCHTVCQPVPDRTSGHPALSHSVDRFQKTKVLEDDRVSMYQRTSRSTEVCRPPASAGSAGNTPQHTPANARRAEGSNSRQVHVDGGEGPARSRWSKSSSLLQTANSVAEWAIEKTQEELKFILKRDKGCASSQDVAVTDKKGRANEGNDDESGGGPFKSIYTHHSEREGQSVGGKEGTEAEQLAALFLDAVIREIKSQLSRQQTDSAGKKDNALDNVAATHATWLVEAMMDKVVCDVQNELCSLQLDPSTSRCLVDIFGCFFNIEVVDAFKEAVFNAMDDKGGQEASGTVCKLASGPEDPAHSIRKTVHDISISVKKGLLSEEVRKADEKRKAELTKLADERKTELDRLAEELRKSEEARKAGEIALQRAKLDEVERAKKDALERERLGTLSADDKARLEAAEQAAREAERAASEAERAAREAEEKLRREARERAQLEEELAKIRGDLEEENRNMLMQRFSKEEKFMRKTLAQTKTGNSEAERIFEKHLNMALSRQAAMVVKKALISALGVANLEKKIHYGLLVLNIEYALNLKVTTKKLDSKKMSKDTRKLIKDYVFDKDETDFRLLSVRGSKIKGFDVKLNLENRDLLGVSQVSQISNPSSEAMSTINI